MALWLHSLLVFLANSFSSPLRVALCTLKSWCPQGSVLVPFIAPHILPVLTFASTTTFLWCLCHHGGLPAARDTFQSTFHPNNQWYLSKMQIKTGHYAVINKQTNEKMPLPWLKSFHGSIHIPLWWYQIICSFWKASRYSVPLWLCTDCSMSLECSYKSPQSQFLLVFLDCA